jgi:hypothetical protein
MRNSHKLSKEDTARYLSENYVLVMVNPATWRVPVLTRGRTRGKRMSRNSPPAALVLYESDETGGERCAVRTAGSKTGVQRGIPSDDGDKIGAVAVVLSETGTEMGSSDLELKCKNSDRGAMISVLEDAEKHSVLWAHDKTGEIPHTANAELSHVLRLQFQF